MAKKKFEDSAAFGTEDMIRRVFCSREELEDLRKSLQAEGFSIVSEVQCLDDAAKIEVVAKNFSAAPSEATGKEFVD